VAIACLSRELELNSEVTHYVQIVGIGLSLLFLFKGIITDIDQSRASGKLRAESLITENILNAPKLSILQRFQRLEEMLSTESSLKT
jgi:hypothetical protein